MKKENLFKIDENTFEITFLEPMLGTTPLNKNVYEQYIMTKAKELTPEIEAELETIEEVEEKGWSGFMKDDEGIFIYNYMIKGFLKAAVQVLIENKAINKIPAYKSWIDKLVFVKPRKLYFLDNGDRVLDADDYLERPLRVMTPKGERTSLARSDIMEPGKKVRFTVKVMKNTKGLSLETIEKALCYGEFNGLGQWRNAEYGSFEWEKIGQE